MMLEDGEGLDQDLIDEYNGYYNSLNQVQKDSLKPHLRKLKRLIERGNK